MNQSEYQQLRAAARIDALTVLLAWVADMFHTTYADLQSPERLLRLRSIQEVLAEKKKHYLEMTVPGHSAEMSDLKAGEFQEAFSVLSKRFADCVAGESPRGESTFKFLSDDW
ncbi:MAG: hypothetical protein ABTR20_13355 [Candidatus Competibacter sp.]